MKKVICLLFVILLSSCSNTDTDTTVETVSKDNVIESESNTEILNPGQEVIGDVSAKIQNIPDIYMKDENFKFCMVQNIDACINDFKFQNPEITSCDDFLTESGVEMCKVTEVTAQARQDDSMEICDTLSSGVDSCKNEVAVSIWMKTWKIDSCDQLWESYVNECKNQVILSNAINARDDSICDQLILSDESMTYEKDFCKQEITMQIENDEFEKQIQEDQERMQKEMDAQMAEEEANLESEAQ